MNTVKKIKLCVLLLTIKSISNCMLTQIPQEIDIVQDIERINNFQDILSVLEQHGIKTTTNNTISSVAMTAILLLRQALQDAKLGNEKKAKDAINVAKKNIALLQPTGRSTTQNPFAKLLNQNVIDLVTAKVMLEIKKAQEPQNTILIATQEEAVAQEQSAQEPTELIGQNATENTIESATENAKEQAAEEARRKKDETRRAKEEARRAKEQARQEKEEARRIKEQARLAKEQARREKAEKKEAERILNEKTTKS